MQQHRHSLDNPIPLPFTPSGPAAFEPSDTFNVHKIRLAPIQTRRRPTSGQLPFGPSGLEGRPVPIGQGRTDPGPVAEGHEEAEMSAASDAAMSDAGSSRAGDDFQGGKWGVLQAAKNAFFKRYDKAAVAVAHHEARVKDQVLTVQSYASCALQSILRRSQLLTRRTSLYHLTSIYDLLLMIKDSSLTSGKQRACLQLKTCDVWHSAVYLQADAASDTQKHTV